jgi:hypothetical protein
MCLALEVGDVTKWYRSILEVVSAVVFLSCGGGGWVHQSCWLQHQSLEWGLLNNGIEVLEVKLINFLENREGGNFHGLNSIFNPRELDIS